MKNNKLPLIISLVSLVGVILLFVFHFTGDNEKNQKQNLEPKNTRIAYVNIDSVVNNYDYYNALSLQLAKKQQDLETQLQSKTLSLQNRAYQLQQKMSQHLITSQDYQKKGQKLSEEQAQLQQWQQQKGLELQEDQMNLTNRVYDSIVNVVNIINKNKDYDIIISNQYQGALLFANPDWNLSSQVIKILNERAPLNDTSKVAN
ncbi:MAG: OmpH family outer membrane protein [Bacteroidota bacterium]|nr:OmpH family outer membrane protein [Bacteroidota bacterium]